MNIESAGRRVGIGSIAILLFLAAIWGGSIPATKLGLRDFPPLTLTALRYLVAAPCFLVLLITRPMPPFRARLAMIAFGVVGVGIGQTCQVLGVERTTASVATVITSIIPILVVLLAALRLGQPMGTRHALGLAAAFLGVGLVATGDPRRLSEALGGDSLVGDAMMMVSALAIAGYYVLSVEFVGRYSAVTVAAWTSLSGAAALTPLMLWELRSRSVQLHLQGLGVVLYLALLVTVLGMWIWFWALARLPARVAASLQYLQPLVGVAASALLFAEPLGLWFALGTILVLAGIALSTLPARRARDSSFRSE
ncbi:MAG: DMT family transporter [Acidobacteriota bacterium]